MTERAMLLDSLLANPQSALTVPRTEAVALLVEMARLERALELSLTVPAVAVAGDGQGGAPPSQLLTIAEAAERSRKSVRWIRDHWRTEMPFAVRKGRTLLFPKAPFERWMKQA